MPIEKGPMSGQWPSEEDHQRFQQELRETLALLQFSEDLPRWVDPADQSRFTQMQIDPSLWWGPRPMLFVLLPKKVLEDLFWIFLLKLLLELPLPPFEEEEEK